MSTKSEMQSLFAAARQEMPARATQDAMWKKLELGLGAAVPAPEPSGVRTVDAAPTSTPSVPSSPPPPPPVLVGRAASAPSTSTAPFGAVLKAGLIGGGVGSVITVLALLTALPSGRPATSSLPSVESRRETVDVAGVERENAHHDRAPSVLVPFDIPMASSSPEEPSPQAARRPDESDVLAREVSLVVSAREALIAGDSSRAVELAQRARKLHGQLEKEALTLEVRALRAQGRESEADRAEMELRVRHPR